MKAINIWLSWFSVVVFTALGFLGYMVLFRDYNIKGLARTKEQLDQGSKGMTASIYLTACG